MTDLHTKGASTRPRAKWRKGLGSDGRQAREAKGEGQGRFRQRRQSLGDLRDAGRRPLSPLTIGMTRIRLATLESEDNRPYP